MSGYNNPGFNQGGGYGGNQNFGYGGQQPSYGYAGGYGGNPSGGFNTNMNVGGGFGMNTAQPVSTKTPFDFQKSLKTWGSFLDFIIFFLSYLLNRRKLP